MGHIARVTYNWYTIRKLLCTLAGQGKSNVKLSTYWEGKE